MRPSSVTREFLVSNPSPRGIGIIGTIALALGSAIALARPSLATGVAGEVPSLKPPVLKVLASVSPPSPGLAIPEDHRTDLQVLSPGSSASGKNNFIDPRDHAPPTEVIVTERRGGCRTIARGGQLVGGRCPLAALAPAPRQRPRARRLPPVEPLASRPVRVVALQPRRSPTRLATPAPFPARRNVTVATPRVAPVRLAPPRVIPSEVGTVVALNPPRWNGVKLALAPVTRLAETYPTVEPAGAATIARATRLEPAPDARPRRTDLLFPLAIPAPITSVFGWRRHPISGAEAPHAGTDLGAPMGTPVLAAYPGEVATADWVGGYGLMVVLRHLDGTQESRYAHLSEIAVKPGERVEQGTVIGRAGSTGLSTGPHLHFEWRHLTERGWTAVDAGLHLEFALENLLQKMQVATVPDRG